jgi:hypothetical protein
MHVGRGRPGGFAGSGATGCFQGGLAIFCPTWLICHQIMANCLFPPHCAVGARDEAGADPAGSRAAWNFRLFLKDSSPL